MRSTRGILSRVAALALALPSGSAVAEWTGVGRADEIYAAYADVASIRRSGNMVRMHGLYDFRRQDYTPEGRGLFSTAVLREYDCQERRVRLLSSIDFSAPMGAGTAVSTSDTPRRWEPVVAGGIDEGFWKVACGAQ